VEGVILLEFEKVSLRIILRLYMEKVANLLCYFGCEYFSWWCASGGFCSPPPCLCEA